MFKSILPSRRIVSSEFQMVTSPSDPTFSESNGKENYFVQDVGGESKAKPEKKKKVKGGKEQSQTAGVPTDAEFERMLDEMQIPTTLRPKLATMDPTVKAAFLKSSQILSQTKPAPTAPLTPRGLRKALSSESLASPHPSTRQKSPLEKYDIPSSSRVPAASRSSLDVSRPSGSYSASGAKPSKDKRAKGTPVTPEKYVALLLGTSTTEMDVEIIKKLRLLLRNETASWTEEFLERGGYGALLTRLNEILEVEWREEQHDDQILHELLRCFKALLTSAVGCQALRDYCPQPYNALVFLLYSDKRPGEVGTRQLIIELLLGLFDLYPASSLPAVGSPAAGRASHARSRSVPWETDSRIRSSSSLITLPAPHSTLFSLLKSLLLTRPPPPSENPTVPIEPLPFIEEIHLPRIYKTYLQELSDLCRDYFWVFCHNSNTIWNLDETDETKVEKPRAPGGMTGGVESEAMAYMTLHFRFVNALATCAQDLNLPKTNEYSAYQFHRDMFLSGMERILLLSRKASTVYYPTLHLEIARYVTAVGRAGFDVPWGVSRLIGPPPSSMRRAPQSRSTPSTPSKRVGAGGFPGSVQGGAPVLPPVPGTRKVTPMFN